MPLGIFFSKKITLRKTALIKNSHPKVFIKKLPSNIGKIHWKQN